MQESACAISRKSRWNNGKAEGKSLSRRLTWRPVVFIPKIDSPLWFLIRYRCLNAITARDECTLPKMDEFFDRLGEAQIISILDANSRYLHTPITPKDGDEKTFTMHLRTYVFTLILFGLKNESATNQ